MYTISVCICLVSGYLSIEIIFVTTINTYDTEEELMNTKATLTVIMLVLALTLAGCAPASDTHSEGETMTTEETMPSETMEEEKMEDDTMTETSMDDESMSEEDMDASDEMTAENELPDMTLDELKMFNGQDGQPVYVAVDGIVYDLTHLDKWKTGQHMGGQHDAGQDLSEAILKSPHGKKILERAIPVAKLVE